MAIKVLVACEESQTVCKAFRDRGFEAYSCDIQKPSARKATCLWLKGLPKLTPTNIVDPVVVKYKNGNGTDNPWHLETLKLSPEERAKERSKTFPGIAKAMAEQWGDYIKEALINDNQ